MRSVLLVLLAAALLGCGGSDDRPTGDASSPEVTPSVPVVVANVAEVPPRLRREDVADAVRPCFDCHRSIVSSFADHGMARSIGPVEEIDAGTVRNPTTGLTYEIRVDGEAGEKTVWLETSFPDGGLRRQQIVGRIGAGILDSSWVTMDVDDVTGEPTRRLFFAPVETIRGHGHELSPFELQAPAAGPDFVLDGGCLTCHTLEPLADLPGAAAVAGHVFPANALGENAFEHLDAFACDACHGDPSRHLETAPPLPGEDPGLVRLGELEPAVQRDVCARCHLQGDARLELIRGRPSNERPLAGQIPMLVPRTSRKPGDEYRFVSQVERLVLSECFRGAPEMTCTTCHDPHRGAEAQGVASFNTACQGCHETESPSACSRSRSPELTVEAAAGVSRRSEAGCIDCHVRKSQPFDLPHVASADHLVRRRIDPPEELPHRQFADLSGELDVFDDGRLEAAWKTPEGARWRRGVLAMGLVTMGRNAEAAEHFDVFPTPGSPAARQPDAPAELVPLETSTTFHQLRALALASTGRRSEALDAYSDALVLDPMEPSVRLGRARLRLAGGDVRGVLEDTQFLIDNFPRSEQPWLLRVEMAEQMRRPDLARTALLAAVDIWPPNAVAWYKLGLLHRQVGDEARAVPALERARRLRPSLFGADSPLRRPTP